MTDSVGFSVLGTGVGTQRNITSSLRLVPALVPIRKARLRNPRQLPGATLKPDPILGRSRTRVGGFGVLVFLLVLLFPARALADSPVDGWASEYGPGNGVAMNFCTWTLRHESDCGWVRIQSLKTGIVVTTRVVDWCYCLVPGSPHPSRLVDLQYGVVRALGLDQADGMFEVSVERLGPAFALPNTATTP